MLLPAPHYESLPGVIRSIGMAYQDWKKEGRLGIRHLGSARMLEHWKQKRRMAAEDLHLSTAEKTMLEWLRERVIG